MKKIIANLIFIVLCFAVCFPAYADGELTPIQDRATATMTYNVNPSYIVLIPETISANEGYTFRASKMDIYSNQAVCVFIDLEGDSITMSDGNGQSILLVLRGVESGNCVARFTRDELTSTISFYGEPADAPRAGSYSATVEFYITLEG